MKLVIFALDGLFDTGLTVLLDTFAMANELAAARGFAAPPLDVTLVARFMLIDKRSSQAEYIIPDHLAQADPWVARFERWARDNLSSGFSLQAAAAALSVGLRTLQQRTEAVLGKSPRAFFQDLRIERKQYLVSIGYDIEAIAGEVGYADSVTLRTLLRRRPGRGVRESRAGMR